MPLGSCVIFDEANKAMTSPVSFLPWSHLDDLLDLAFVIQNDISLGEKLLQSAR